MPYIGRGDFQYRIVVWSSDGEHIALEPAGLDDLDMARAAYAIAVKKWPDDPVTLQQGMRVIEKSREFIGREKKDPPGA